jgi:hypothetical protein
MADRYPGYDVLSKRDGLSWNDATRRTVAQRLSLPSEPRFFNQEQWQTLNALCACIVPQSGTDEPVPLAAMLDFRLLSGRTDGFRRAGLPQQDEAWRRGLAALEAESRSAHLLPFRALGAEQQLALLRRWQTGGLRDVAWGDMSSQAFFQHRVLLDLAAAYYSHPHTWSQIGFGGPASPRGYVRMDFDRRDPWEAAQALPGGNGDALQENLRVR